MARRLVVLVAIVALALGALLAGWWETQSRGPLEHAGASVGKGGVSSEAGAPLAASSEEGAEPLSPWGAALPTALPRAAGVDQAHPQDAPPHAEGPELPRETVLSEPYVPLLPAKRPGQRTVVLDPGHGGGESEAVHRSATGPVVLVEKTVNLSIALRLRDLLEAEGFRAVLTREGDGQTLPEEVLDEVRGYRRVRADLQARVDIANAAQAELFLSIHNNGSGSPTESGTEVWYDPHRPFAERNVAFARLLQEHVIAALRAVGYPVYDRGIKSDAAFRMWRGQAYPLFVLGPPRTGRRTSPATQMPGALREALFVSNDADATALRRDEVQAAIARGARDAILHYFQRFP